jgi:hypothetical protein
MQWLVSLWWRLWTWLFPSWNEEPKILVPEHRIEGYTLLFEDHGMVYPLLCTQFNNAGSRANWNRGIAPQLQRPFEPFVDFGRIVGKSQVVRRFFELFGDVTQPHDLLIRRTGCKTCLLRRAILTQVGCSVAAGDMTILDTVRGIYFDLVEVEEEDSSAGVSVAESGAQYLTTFATP